MIKNNNLVLYTIGHSTRSLEDFLILLKANQITHLIDVRIYPKSRRMPWFSDNKLNESLQNNSINYTHLKVLGGMRQPKKNSPNTGWRKDSFRGYADYMITPEFHEGLKQLNNLLNEKANVAIMCAEKLPSSCHRSLIADAEVAQGIAVKHIIDLNHPTQDHRLTTFAVVRSSDPVYIEYPEKQLKL